MTLLPPKGPTKEGTEAYRQAMGEEEYEVHTIARRVFYDKVPGRSGHIRGFFSNMLSDEREGWRGGGKEGWLSLLRAGAYLSGVRGGTRPTLTYVSFHPCLHFLRPCSGPHRPIL